jgi:hypothetical protein
VIIRKPLNLHILRDLKTGMITGPHALPDDLPSLYFGWGTILI